MREDVHVQVPDRVLREAVEAEQEIVFPQPLERGLHGFEVVEDGGADGGVGVAVAVVVIVGGGEEFPVLLVEGAFGACEDLGFAVGAGPEAEEVRSHFADEEAVVGRGGGVDDVVDAGLGDDEGVGEGLAFRALVRGRGGVLAGVVGGEVSDDVGVGGFAEDEVGGVVGGIFLFGGLLGVGCGIRE